MQDYIDMKEFKKAKRKARIRETTQAVAAWIDRNRDIAMALVPTVIGVGGGAVKLAKKHHTISQERHLKEDYVYDRTLGKYLKPTRKLSKKEWRDVARRKANGEKYVNIFDDMGVL